MVSEWDTGGLTVKEKTAYWRSGNEENLNLVYLDGSDIRTRSLPRGESPLMLSHLDLATNTWAVIRSASTKYTSYNSLNSVRDGRRLSKVAFSHGGALAEDVLPDNTILKLSKDYVFALFPSELGYAQRIHIDSGEVKELKLFNLRQIKK